MRFKDVDRAVGIFGEDGVKQSLVLALHFFVSRPVAGNKAR
jgi:hypothetical protein